MKQEYKDLQQCIRTNNARLFAALLSKHPKLRSVLLKRYGSTTFKTVSNYIRYRDQLEYQICPKCRKLLKDCKCYKQKVEKLLNLKSLFKLLKSKIDHNQPYDSVLK